MKIVKKILVALLVIFVIMQFFGPDKNQGEIASIDAFIAETNPPTEVHEILKNNCFDCHSNVTKYPWYNNITPVNYWMDDHVRHGKGDFNVSQWESYSVKKKDHKIEELIEEVEERHMPLPSYTWTHGELSDDDIKAVVDWGNQVRAQYRSQIQPE